MEKSCMNGTIKEWIQKAEGDFATAAREVRASQSPNYDAACFHAEQCVEKLMKALPIHRGVTPPRTHDLIVLDHLLAPPARIGHGQSRNFVSSPGLRWCSAIRENRRTERRRPKPSKSLPECGPSCSHC